MSEELKPCPHCGSESCRVIGGPGTKGGPQFWAGCDYCNGRAWGDTQSEAIAAWNRRAPMTAPTPAGEEMGAALEKCAQQFDFYAREHAVKADRALSAGKYDEARASAVKAKVNADFAAMCKASLLSSPRVEERVREAALEVVERRDQHHSPNQLMNAIDRLSFALSLPDGEGKEKLATRSAEDGQATAPTDRL